VGTSKHNTILWCSKSPLDTLHHNKVLCFDVPTRYPFDIWYYNHTQRGWTT